MFLTDLPVEILQRIFQYLLDHPAEHHGWLSGVQHIMDLRLTSRYLNTVVKESFLEFDLKYLSYQTHDGFDLLPLIYGEQFLSLLDHEFNWLCRSFKILIFNDEGEDDWKWIQALIAKLVTFESIFRKRIRFLTVNAVGCFGKFCEMEKLMSSLLTPATVIDLKIDIEDFHGNMVSKFVHCEHRIGTLTIQDLPGSSENARNQIITNISRAFPNVKAVVLTSSSSFHKDLALLKSARKLIINQNYRRFDSTLWQGIPCENIEHVVFGNKKSVSVDSDVNFISKYFPNLTHLSFGYSPTWKEQPAATKFHLPPSCVTVKIDLGLLNCITECPHIKNLQLQTFTKSKRLLLKRSNVENFKFQLETFVFVSSRAQYSPYSEYTAEIVRPLLETQPSLRVLTLEFWTDSRSDFCERGEESQSSNAKEVNKIKEAAESVEDILLSHQCLQLFRLKDVFIVLKSDINQQLISFIDYLDTECDWSIRTYFVGGNQRKKSVLMLKPWEFAIRT